MTATLINIAVFLITTLFSMYMTAILLRFLFQWVKADFYNPICQFLIKVTNPLLIPFRRIIPGWFGLDIASLVLLFIVQLLELGLLTLLFGTPFNSWVLLIAVLKLLQLVLNTYFFAVLLRAITSWFAASQYHPGVILLQQLTEPILRPARRLIPPIAGIDLSPVAVLIVLQILSMLLQSWVYV